MLRLCLVIGIGIALLIVPGLVAFGQSKKVIFVFVSQIAMLIREEYLLISLLGGSTFVLVTPDKVELHHGIIRIRCDTPLTSMHFGLCDMILSVRI